MKKRLVAVYTGLALICLLASSQLSAQPRTIVAIGASNTSGWGVGEAKAYPARLEEMLRSRRYDARVINAGRPFDTTGSMLKRLDVAVPPRTDIVILQPGANDLRFFGTPQNRASNIHTMVEHLIARKVVVIVFDPAIPSTYYQWDRIHITEQGHQMFAARLFPQVLAGLHSRQAAKQSQ